MKKLCGLPNDSAEVATVYQVAHSEVQAIGEFANDTMVKMYDL